MSRRTFAIIGAGTLANSIADAYEKGLLPEYEPAAVLGRDPEHAQVLASRLGVTGCSTIEAMVQKHPDIVIEAASVEAVRAYAEAVLRSGSDLVTISVGAFAEDEFRSGVEAAARMGGGKVLIPAGCIGGLDAVRTVTAMGMDHASLDVIQPPEHLIGKTGCEEDLLKKEERICIFDGTARQAIDFAPTQINIGVATALAAAGANDTRIRMFCEKGIPYEKTIIRAETEAVQTEMIIFDQSPDMAAYSIVAVLNNVGSPIMFA